MSQQEIERFVRSLENVQRSADMGYIFYFYGDNHMVPFTTIAEHSNKYEEVSKLDREGVFRVNIGVSKATFDSLFPEVNEQTIDYTALDIFMPHPHYAKQFFICIINPSDKNAEQLKKYITEAHAVMKDRLK
jgi:hypothetical protein